MSQKKIVQKNTDATRICPVSRKCGGCQLMNMTYEEQLRYKQAKVVEDMLAIAKELLDKEREKGNKNETLD